MATPRGFVIEPYAPPGTTRDVAEAVRAFDVATDGGTDLSAPADLQALFDRYISNDTTIAMGKTAPGFHKLVNDLRQATMAFLATPADPVAQTAYAAALQTAIATVTAAEPDYATLITPAAVQAVVRASMLSLAPPTWDATQRHMLTASTRASNMTYSVADSLLFRDGLTAQNVLMELIKGTPVGGKTEDTQRSVILQILLGILATPEEIKQKLLPVHRSDPAMASAIEFLSMAMDYGGINWMPPVKLDGLSHAAIVGCNDYWGTIMRAYRFLATAVEAHGKMLEPWETIVGDRNHPLFFRLSELTGAYLMGARQFGPDSVALQRGMLARRREARMSRAEELMLAREAARIYCKGPARVGRPGLWGLVY